MVGEEGPLKYKQSNPRNVNTIKASHNFSLLDASRMGGAHLNRVSPS